MHRALCRITFVLDLFLLSTVAHAAKPEPSIANERPDPVTFRRYGPAYRYPRAGWIVLHIEGTPYDRGYQHGRLMAGEIVDYAHTLAAKRSKNAPADAWQETRKLVNALFLRRYDAEYIEEMKGIADGAAAGGGKVHGRPVDLLDVVTINSDIELEFLDAALDATPTGLEGRKFREPSDQGGTASPPEHCSAFAATGPATADGKIVFGHITMFTLTFVRHFNVWLDVKPVNGQRVVMQTYPGGIQSGMDYYLNDAGLLVTETTVKQTRFDINGQALASRIRKAVQYADSIDKAVAILKEGNNGLYTNEWLLADTKTDEIAMFELGTHKNKLWRSGNDDWFGGTKGFYWGCNNAKDVEVRLETIPSVIDRPANVVWHPSDRDRAWLRLYNAHKGKIGEAFGFEAFTTPPLVGFPSLDAKFTTSALAKDLKSWAVFGPPLGKTWEPSEAERTRYSGVRPLVSNDWTVLSVESPELPPKTDQLRVKGDKRLDVEVRVNTSEIKLEKLNLAIEPVHLRNALPDQPTLPAARPAPVDFPKTSNPQAEPFEEPEPDASLVKHPPAWHGTILAKTDADTWLAAAFADYEKIVALELAHKATAQRKKRELTRVEKESIDVAKFAHFAAYKAAGARSGQDVPLNETKAALDSDNWYQIASGKGVFLLDALHHRLGDHDFTAAMEQFGRSNAGKAVTTDEFITALKSHSKTDLAPFFQKWLTKSGLPDGPRWGSWSVDSFEAEPEQAVIVYGTLKESDAQRAAALKLQRQIERRWSNITVPVVSDRDATPDDLKNRHLLLVGRPDTIARFGNFATDLPVTFGIASFRVNNDTYAHPLTAVIVAAQRAGDPRHEVVIYAGLSAEATWHCVDTAGDRAGAPAEVLILPANGKPRRLAVEHKERGTTDQSTP